MQKLKELINYIQPYDFKSCYKVERDPRIKIKLQTLYHLQNGKKLIEVADIVIAEEKTIESHQIKETKIIYVDD